MRTKSQSSPSGLGNRTWAALLAIVSALVLVLDLMTGSIGLIQTAGRWVLPGPMPEVRLTPVRTDGGTECLEFAFSSLPDNFALGDVYLRILDSTGPTRLSGDMSAEIVRVLVNKEISPAVLAGRAGPIVFRAAFAAERENDNAYIDFCPILTTPGTGGQVRVVPSFRAPNGESIDRLQITTHDGSPVTDGIVLDLSRANNVDVSVNETRTRLIPLQTRDPVSRYILTAPGDLETSEDLAALTCDRASTKLRSSPVDRRHRSRCKRVDTL